VRSWTGKGNPRVAEQGGKVSVVSLVIPYLKRREDTQVFPSEGPR